MNTAICRYCGKEGATIKTLAYWHQSLPRSEKVYYFCHPECKKQGELQEAIDCQTIDADCNDCKHFSRSTTLIDSIPKGIKGHCKLFNKPTIAYPSHWTGRPCFEHRRTI